MDKEALRTAHALQGARLTGSFRAAFANARIGEMTVDMTEPEQTTAAGRLAKQHIVAKNAAGASIVLGTVDTFAKRAELRSYDVVAAMHGERFKKKPAFDAAAYDELAKKMRSTLMALGVLDVVVITDAPGVPAAARKSSSTLLVAVAVAVGVAVGVVGMILAGR